MATHSAFVLWKKRGHSCVERSFDGDHLHDKLRSIIECAETEADMIRDLKELVKSGEDMGDGLFEFSSEREHDQVFFVSADLHTKKIGYWSVVLEKKHLQKLFSWGWDIEFARDCECNM